MEAQYNGSVKPTNNPGGLQSGGTTTEQFKQTTLAAVALAEAQTTKVEQSGDQVKATAGGDGRCLEGTRRS